MPSIPAHTLARPPDFDQTGAYWVLDATGARMGTVRRYYPAGRRTGGAWLYLPLVHGAAVAEPQRSLADAARYVAVAADVIRRRHATGDHTLCLPAACLAVRYAAEHRRLRGGEQS